MLEETNAPTMNMNSSSIWSSMASWFTPTVLFLLLNLMIGTIALSSTVSYQKQKHPKKNQEPHHHHLDRSPSVLHRLRSINFSSFRFHETSIFKSSPDSAETHHPQTFEESQFQDTHQETPVLESPATHYIFRQEYYQEESHTHYTFQQEEEERESMDEVYSRLNRRPESQSQPEVKTSAEEEEEEEVPEKKKKKKAASMKSRVNPFEEGENLERRRPETMKERGTAVDLEVDARADDFINRFKQQLKMQRLDSILRYKEMIGRGAGK